MERFQLLHGSSPPSLSSLYLPSHFTYHNSHATITKSSSHHSLEVDDLGGLGAINSFTKKLYHMVTTEDPDIISFTPDGLAFHVKDPKRLEMEVLPRYFRHSRFQSLVRQLNFYNFRKASKERVLWVYRHKLFRRDRPDLLECLRRKPSANLTKNRLNRANNSTASDSFMSFTSSDDHRPGPSDRRQPYLNLEDLNHHQPFSPTFASGRTSSTSSASYHSPSSGRTSEATTPDSENFPLSPAGLGLFSRKRQRSERADSVDSTRSERELEEEVQTLEAFMELSRVRTGHSPTESAATSRDDDEDEEEEEEGSDGDDDMGKDEMDTCVLQSLSRQHHDACMTSGDDHSDIDDNTTITTIASIKGAMPPLPSPAPIHVPTNPQRLSPLGNLTPTSDDRQEWTMIQNLSCEAWESTEGLVYNLSEQLPSYTHCQFTLFCLETAPYVNGPTLCDAIHTVLTTCSDVAQCLTDTVGVVNLDHLAFQEDFQSLLNGWGREGTNDQLVRVFLSLALNHLSESMACLTGKEAEVLHRCHRLWARHATRFY